MEIKSSLRLLFIEKDNLKIINNCFRGLVVGIVVGKEV